jgi:hypothetical protein
MGSPAVMSDVVELVEGAGSLGAVAGGAAVGGALAGEYARNVRAYCAVA